MTGTISDPTSNRIRAASYARRSSGDIRQLTDVSAFAVLRGTAGYPRADRCSRPWTSPCSWPIRLITEPCRTSRKDRISTARRAQ